MLDQILVLLTLLGFISASSLEKQEQQKFMLEIGTINQCEGKDVYNYTYVNLYNLNSNCEQSSDSFSATNLVVCASTGERSVISLQSLASSAFPDGANGLYMELFLCKSGPLAGKFALIRESYQRELYLKKCSSVLGYSYTVSKIITLLIAEKLDISMFVHPGGLYDPFKKVSSTICSGTAYTV